VYHVYNFTFFTCMDLMPESNSIVSKFLLYITNNSEQSWLVITVCCFLPDRGRMQVKPLDSGSVRC
jgi:hypothetical protein